MCDVLNLRTPSRRLTTLFLLALLTASILAIYGRTLTGYFVGDDFGYVSLYYRFPLSNGARLFVEEWSQGIWGFKLAELRPIPAFSFMVDAIIWRGEATGYRITNLLIYAACSYLVFRVGRHLVRLDGPVAIAAALLFAVHPAHVAPVAWITGRVDLFPTLFCLAGLLAFARFRETRDFRPLVLSYGCYFGAAFSKEYGLVLPLLIAAWDFSHPGKDEASASLRRQPLLWRAVPYAGYFLVLGFYYVCRRKAFDSGLAIPESHGWAHMAGQQIEYWRHLLALERVTGGRLFSWKEGASVVQLSLAAFGAIVAMTALAVILPLLRRRAGSSVPRLLFCGPIWFLVTTLPFVVISISPRHLYLASVGYCLFIAALMGTVIGQQRRAWGYVLVAVLAGTWGFDAWGQTASWQRAGSMTRKLVAQIRLLADTPPDTVLIMNLPMSRDGAWVFAWSSPFLFERPFLKQSLRERLIVFETPSAYYYSPRWNSEREIERLNRVKGDITALNFEFDDTSQEWVVRRVDPERLKSAATVLQEEIKRDPAQDPNQLWEQFRSNL